MRAGLGNRCRPNRRGDARCGQRQAEGTPHQRVKPGDGLHFPYTWPHWVENGAEVSISYSITFQTRRQERRNALYNINHQLRKRGLRPRPVGGSRLRDTALLGAYMGLRSLKRFCRGRFTNPLPRYRQESHA